MEKKIMVSIICNTYNHESYIRDALESFVTQKTNFKFEVLVHDDASTDNTADIIREYERKYPDIIKPIYQTENQYSKKVSNCKSFQYPRAKGKYIALCEGDDYWISTNKLQKQFDFMESHPEYSLCIHNGYHVNAETKEIILTYPNTDADTEITIDEIILDAGECMLTNSMFFRKEYRDIYPEIFQNNPIGDYPLAIYLSLCGKVHCLKEPMSAYRVMSKGSWSSKNMSKTEQGYRNRIILLKKLIEFLINVDEYTANKYNIVIQQKIYRYNMEIMQKFILLKDKENYLKQLKILKMPVLKRVFYGVNYITRGNAVKVVDKLILIRKRVNKNGTK